MQTAIRSLLKEELAEVRGWNEVVSLRMEAISTSTCSIVRVISLSLVQARFTVRPTPFLTHAQRAALRPVHSLTIHIDRFLSNLATVDIYFKSQNNEMFVD